MYAPTLVKPLRQYLNPGYRYVFTQGPDLACTKPEALENGINCISLAHLVIQDLFSVTLPTSLKSSELYKDRVYFDVVDDLADMQLGDLIFFGLKNPPQSVEDFKPDYSPEGELRNWREFPVKHVAIYTGVAERGDYVLLHSTSVAGTNTLWALEEFSKYANYQKIYGIKRIKQPDSSY